MEYKEFRDDPHLPEDAGEYADDLTDILNRIPNGWGKWLTLDKGWYRLIAETNRKLRFMYPDYEIHQVKEKFGGLRYYFSPTRSRLSNRFTRKRFRKKWDKMDKLVKRAEEIAWQTCEFCGNTENVKTEGHMGGRGWTKTLCENCRTKRDTTSTEG